MVAQAPRNRRVRSPHPAKQRHVRHLKGAAPYTRRGVVLADFTTGRASLFPHALPRPGTGAAWSLLRAICGLNPNLALAPLHGEYWKHEPARAVGRPHRRRAPQRRRPADRSVDMAKRTIYITKQDAARLREWLQLFGHRHDRDRQNLDVLRRELDRAHLIEPHQVPSDVVTMHSRVRLADSRTDQKMCCTLAFPEDAVANHERISVLAPLGAAILGCRAGDAIRFQVPGGRRTVRILKVLYQPEAAGDFHP